MYTLYLRMRKLFIIFELFLFVFCCFKHDPPSIAQSQATVFRPLKLALSEDFVSLNVISFVL